MSVAAFHPEADRASGRTDRVLQQTRIAGEARHEAGRVRADWSRVYADVRDAACDGEARASRGDS